MCYYYCQLLGCTVKLPCIIQNIQIVTINLHPTSIIVILKIASCHYNFASPLIMLFFVDTETSRMSLFGGCL